MAKTETVDRSHSRNARKRGSGKTPEHILLAKRYEPNPVQHMSRPSFPCQDPIVASGKNKNELGEQESRFKSPDDVHSNIPDLGDTRISARNVGKTLSFGVRADCPIRGAWLRRCE